MRLFNTIVQVRPTSELSTQASEPETSEGCFHYYPVTTGSDATEIK